MLFRSIGIELVLFKAGTGGYGCYRIPALVRTGADTVLAFAEARESPSCADRGDIDIVVRRSTNDGRTWGPARVVLSGVPEDLEKPFTRGNPAPVVDRETGRVFLLSTSNEAVPGGERRPWVQHSDDDGVTWSAARQVPASFDVKNPCIITGTSSGSRGIYGAIATSGEWGLKHGCAVAYTDKGSGTGVHDLAANTVNLIDGVRQDAVTAGKARGCDVVIADTAGRLTTQAHLMEELKKIRRTIAKAQTGAPHEVLLIVDGNTGQNALAQVRAFDEALGLTGLILTKLDGTAKGGVACAIAKERPVPLLFIGVGEDIDDLRPFVAKDFAEALVG